MDLTEEGPEPKLYKLLIFSVSLSVTCFIIFDETTRGVEVLKSVPVKNKILDSKLYNLKESCYIFYLFIYSTLKLLT